MKYELVGFGRDDMVSFSFDIQDHLMDGIENLVACEWGDGIGEMPISKNNAKFLMAAMGITGIAVVDNDWFISPYDDRESSR